VSACLVGRASVQCCSFWQTRQHLGPAIQRTESWLSTDPQLTAPASCWAPSKPPACTPQVDSFNKALQRNTTTGKLTALFKTKMLSRTNTGCSSPRSASSPHGSQGGTGSCLSADEMLQWSNVSVQPTGDRALCSTADSRQARLCRQHRRKRMGQRIRTRQLADRTHGCAAVHMCRSRFPHRC
jgi:hypothetical protein